MKALLLASHGSRQFQANDQIRVLAQQIKEFSTPSYETVNVGFLEFAQPSIADAIDGCINCGAKSVTVVPYFLSAGKHVIQDIPRSVNTAQKKHPHIPIKLISHFGLHTKIAQLIIDHTLSETQGK